MRRWPTPAALAQAPAAEVLRCWSGLGYPRRALRLIEAARVVVDRHGGDLPEDADAIRALPGVGEYTTAAVLAFAFGRRTVVLDTNVRRVLGRLVAGEALPRPTLTRGERERAAALVPQDPATAARWSVAVMELGALVCTSRSPDCERCPVRRQCAWLAAGRPAYDGPARPRQAWQGTDRQCRGRLLARVTDAPAPVPEDELLAVWPDAPQAARCLEGLLADGLVRRVGGHLAPPA